MKPAMIGRITYPHIPDGTVSPQLKSELRKLVDQINAVLAEVENRMELKKEES